MARRNAANRKAQQVTYAFLAPCSKEKDREQALSAQGHDLSVYQVHLPIDILYYLNCYIK